MDLMCYGVPIECPFFLDMWPLSREWPNLSFQGLNF